MSGYVTSIFCRLVGPGGTTVEFYPEPGGVRCVWENETTDEGDGYESTISWDDMRKMMAHAPPVKTNGFPTPQPKRNPQPKKRRRR